jgi:hypothetical protein
LILLNVISFIVGFVMVLATIRSAVRMFILPRAAQDEIVRLLFLFTRRVFYLRVKKISTYQQRDRLMAYYAPLSLLLLLLLWYSMVLTGYTLMFWGLGAESWYLAFRESGSSLLTLGFQAENALSFSILAFTEASIGLILVALLIAYLPTMYAAFSRREVIVKLLEVRAGNPPSAVELLQRYYRNQGIDRLGGEWPKWETWFADIDESHTTLASLVFFRSSQPDHAWINAAGTILDSASLYLSSVDLPFEAAAALCIRAGYLALRHIADFFEISYQDVVHYGDPIQLPREKFDLALDELGKSGLPIVADREKAWMDFCGWRINYEETLYALANLTMAPNAPWINED